MNQNLILASASPRRRELLTQAGYQFTVQVAEVDENIALLPPDLYVMELATLKATAVAKGVKKACPVLGADTVVVMDGRIIGKPATEDEAFAILKDLSGRSHSVYTGLCLADPKTGATAARCAETRVEFGELTDEEIRAYIATGEPMDKAGAYGIQGRGVNFVKSICGEYSNVVGLPLYLLGQMLKEWEQKA